MTRPANDNAKHPGCIIAAIIIGASCMMWAAIIWIFA